MKTSGGKYIAPQKVENMLKTQLHVSQAVLIGDQRKFCVALVTLDPDAMKSWADVRGAALPPPEQWPADACIKALVQAEVDAVNAHLASFEQVKYFRILPRELTVETGELTASLKVKRKVINEKFDVLIEQLYAEAGPGRSSH
jgi:long-chain acyl-CoA synthetase